MADEVRYCTWSELREGITLSTGKRHVLKVVPLCVKVRIHIDPDDAHSLDDKFTLTGFDSAGSPVDEQVQTVKDDQVPGDSFVDLIYVPIEPNLRYSLEVDPGKEGRPYLLFERIPGEELGIPKIPTDNRT